MHYPQGPLDRGMQKIFRRDRRKILCFGIAGRRDVLFIRLCHTIIIYTFEYTLGVWGREPHDIKTMPSGDNRMDTAFRLRDVPIEALLEGVRGGGKRNEKTTAEIWIIYVSLH